MACTPFIGVKITPEQQEKWPHGLDCTMYNLGEYEQVMKECVEENISGGKMTYDEFIGSAKPENEIMLECRNKAYIETQDHDQGNNN